MLPHTQEFFLVKVGQLLLKFVCGEYHIANVSRDHLLGFGYQGFKIININGVANDDQAEVGAVETLGQIADEINFLWFAQVIDHPVDDFVHAHILAHQTLYVAKKRMFLVGLKHLTHPHTGSGKQSGCLKSVELLPDRIGAFAKLCLQSTQIASAAGVQKELEHELDAGFGGDEGFEHGVWLLVAGYWVLVSGYWLLVGWVVGWVVSGFYSSWIRRIV